MDNNDLRSHDRRTARARSEARATARLALQARNRASASIMLDSAISSIVLMQPIANHGIRLETAHHDRLKTIDDKIGRLRDQPVSVSQWQYNEDSATFHLEIYYSMA